MAAQITKYKRIYLESLDGIPGSTHFQWTNVFPQPINEAKQAEVSLCSIPMLSYPIPPYMSNLYFYYSPPVGPTREFRATIPTNINYNLTTFTAALNTALEAAICIASPDPAYIGIVENFSGFFTFTLNPPNGANGNKISFNSSYPLRFVPYGYDRFSEEYHNLSFRIGYGLPSDSGQMYSNTGQFIALNGGISSWAFPNLLRTSFIMIKSDLAAGDTYTTTQQRYNILVKVLVANNTNLGDNIQYQAYLPSPYTIKNLPRSFQSMAFTLIDDEGEIMSDLPAFGSGSCSLEILFRYED
jgi:hypothetical protein